MIKSYEHKSPFDSIESHLLVPIAAETQQLPTEGFALDVLNRFPIASILLGDRLKHGGLELGELYVPQLAGIWVQTYDLAFCAIHRRASEGWREAPRAIAEVLGSIPSDGLRDNRVATAGIPGSGFSGLKGGADIEEIRAALDGSSTPVTVYIDDMAGDREPRVLSVPVRDAFASRP